MISVTFTCISDFFIIFEGSGELKIISNNHNIYYRLKTSMFVKNNHG